MSLKEIVQVNITRESAKVTQAGFGVPLILGQHTKFAEKIRTYSTLEAVAADFDTADLEYKKAAAIFSQQITPEKVKIGKRAANAKQKINVTVPTVADSTSYKVTINGVEFEFVSGSSATASAIVDGLKSAIDAGSQPVTVTDNGDDFDIEADAAGDGFSIVTTANLAITTSQANVNVASELQAVQAVDNDWYFIILTSQTEQDVLHMAEYIETQKKLFFTLSSSSGVKQSIAHIQTLTFDGDFVTGNTINLKIDGTAIAQVTFDTDQATTIGLLAQSIQNNASIDTASVTDTKELTITGKSLGDLVAITEITVASGASQASGTLATTQDPHGNIANKLKAKNYDRTILIYTSTSNNEVEAAWVGLLAPEPPGSITWAFKQLKGVSADTLTDSEKASVHSKNANTFTTVGGVNITEKGTVIGSGEFIDIIRGTDFLQARMEERIFGALSSSKKIPYTNAGIDVFRSIINGVLQLGIDQGILANSPVPVVAAPDISAVDAADKSARTLRNITFTATFAGAIHKVSVQGNISV